MKLFLLITVFVLTTFICKAQKEQNESSSAYWKNKSYWDKETPFDCDSLDNSHVISMATSQMPKFEGGWKKLTEEFETAFPYLTTNIAGIQTTKLIKISFVVECDCSINNISVLDSYDFEQDGLPYTSYEICDSIKKFIKTKKIVTSGIHYGEKMNVKFIFHVAAKKDIVQTQNITKPHVCFVDLGLPSGNLWADNNLSTNNKETSFFSWGENNEFNCRYELDKNKLSNIAGNKQYDAATKILGDEWQTPSSKDFQELIDECKWKWCQKNGHYGFLLKGKSGKTLFFPSGGLFPNNIYPTGHSMYLCSDNLKSKKGLVCKVLHIGPLDKKHFYNEISDVYVYGIGVYVRPIKKIQQKHTTF